MKYIYCLRIQPDDEIITNKISDILNIKPSRILNRTWELEIVEEETDPPIDFVKYFVNILEEKSITLKKLGINKDTITVWMYYEYDEQCNLEIRPEQMEKLSKMGIPLCISCWKKCED